MKVVKLIHVGKWRIVGYSAAFAPKDRQHSCAGHSAVWYVPGLLRTQAAQSTIQNAQSPIDTL
ncbi:hypothetical protein BFR04_05365 [Gaetbulibacter sp. 4G1]|nr:hypothetical protein BFR04_05365 [Gaetbulibacter sp. 4G1]